MTRTKKRLGDLLRERGHISTQRLQAALQEQQDKLALLGEILLERALVNKQDIVAALEEVVGIPYVDCEFVTAQSDALQRIPRNVALQHCVLPLAVQGQKLVTVMAEPQNLRILNELQFVSGKRISPRLGFRFEITSAIEKFYEVNAKPAKENSESDAWNKLEYETQIEFEATGSGDAQKQAIREIQEELARRNSPAIGIVSKVISAASAKRASDIHLEPQAGGLGVRIRVDGVLRDVMQIPSQLQNQVISRVKILADMDIAERRAPQDGRLMVRMGQKKLDLRVSTLPTHYGEKVVIRLLDSSAPLLGFPELGLPAHIEAELKRLLAQPQGTILVTGPTGSGKSTLLYACVLHRSLPGVNIVTVEDPIEYMIPGINQSQVNKKAGMTFAGCLRSILRQDPDVILVGEIRDKETAEIALKAAQTGHLVLSTLHTNDSVAALTRLIDLGVPAHLVAPSVNAIMAQRLVRRLCDCHEVMPMTQEYAARCEAVGLFDPGDAIRVPRGCANCDSTGYRGRIGIYELLIFDEQIRGRVRSEAGKEEISLIARVGGFRTMQEDALEKIRAGITTLDDILRVVPFENVASHNCSACGGELAPAFRFCPYCGSRSHEQPGAHGNMSLQPALDGGKQ